ncbi:hypothetical protein VF04_04360 [Nostoc linckia z7]|uniref:Uncharacterized protein n=2 Tax=Nostoc linckia TaxID=92942 RepID=A0A9Q5ZGI5_NOSLI|nr:hypothetical protein [Nostoc linckia]PHK42945.1 hypothetical protein VF12_01060 [Nostoc linckia z15]PHK48102.1 hypothetical protein VF13_02035 [Nostoc linckia z16]PHJ65022.1 hypothetical protein VF02_11845 [Nostoc linckia z1]PHJ70063.1 hypothetical protein VF05_11240 [Nostoc linckia z3]PHJ75101.1 hypothetical protein VF03_12165 [Nostoc linckia z2]
MLKFTASLQNGGTLYGFGLAESNLNRLEFNDEPIFFDFDYAGHPELFGLILYFGQFATPEEISANPDAVDNRCMPFIDEKYGVTGETLRVFPIAKSIMETMRNTHLYSFETKCEISNPNDIQLFFSGRTEQELADYFRKTGLVTQETRQYKGFEKRDN